MLGLRRNGWFYLFWFEDVQFIFYAYNCQGALFDTGESGVEKLKWFEYY